MPYPEARLVSVDRQGRIRTPRRPSAQLRCPRRPVAGRSSPGRRDRRRQRQDGLALRPRAGHAHPAAREPGGGLAAVDTRRRSHRVRFSRQGHPSPRVAAGRRHGRSRGSRRRPRRSLLMVSRWPSARIRQGSRHLDRDAGERECGARAARDDPRGRAMAGDLPGRPVAGFRVEGDRPGRGVRSSVPRTGPPAGRDPGGRAEPGLESHRSGALLPVPAGFRGEGSHDGGGGAPRRHARRGAAPTPVRILGPSAAPGLCTGPLLRRLGRRPGVSRRSWCLLRPPRPSRTSSSSRTGRRS